MACPVLWIVPGGRAPALAKLLSKLTPYPLQPVRKLLPSSEPQTSKVVSRAVVDLGGTDQPCPRVSPDTLTCDFSHYSSKYLLSVRGAGAEEEQGQTGCLGPEGLMGEHLPSSSWTPRKSGAVSSV